MGSQRVQMLGRSLALAVAGVLTACGGGFTNNGSGTGTLQVNASALFEASGNAETEVVVEVRNAGVEVTDATVTLVDGDTGEEFDAPMNMGNPGRYDVDIPGYRQRLELRISTPAGDELQAKLGGPTPHLINSPLNGAIHRARKNLGVSWRTSDGIRADEVLVSLQPMDMAIATLGKDTGNYTIRKENLRPTAADLEVRRRHVVELAGGAEPSLFTSDYSVVNTIQLTD